MPKTITFEVPDKVCATIMCSALEGGIGYWAQADKLVRDSAGDYVSCVLCECDADEVFDWKADHVAREIIVATMGRGEREILAILLHEVEHAEGAEIGRAFPEYGLRCGGTITKGPNHVEPSEPQ